MFYSVDEIYFMSNCHREELKRTRENSTNKSYDKNRLRIFSLSQILAVMIKGAIKRKENNDYVKESYNHMTENKMLSNLAG